MAHHHRNHLICMKISLIAPTGHINQFRLDLLLICDCGLVRCQLVVVNQLGVTLGGDWKLAPSPDIFLFLCSGEKTIPGISLRSRIQPTLRPIKNFPTRNIRIRGERGNSDNYPCLYSGNGVFIARKGRRVWNSWYLSFSHQIFIIFSFVVIFNILWPMIKILDRDLYCNWSSSCYSTLLLHSIAASSSSSSSPSIHKPMRTTASSSTTTSTSITTTK